MRRSIRYLLATLALLGPAAESRSQQEVAAEHRGGDKIEVDVVVTDRRGRAMSGLGAESFEVLEDGRPVALAGFLAAETTPESRHLGLLLEVSHLAPEARSRLTSELRSFLAARLEAGDRVSLAAHDEGGLEVLTPFTHSAEKTASALGHLAGRRASERSRGRSWGRYLDELRGVYRAHGRGGEPCLEGWAEMVAAARAYAGDAMVRVSASVAALDRLSRSLAELPGRRLLLYLGDGLEQRPGLEAFHFLGELCPERESEAEALLWEYDATPRLLELSAQAGDNRTVLYSFEAPVGEEPAEGLELGGRHLRAAEQSREVRRANRLSGLYLVADESGGTSWLAPDRLAEGLAALAGELDSYYTLTYLAERRDEGAGKHLIEVRLKGKGVRGASVRHRKAVQDGSRDERFHCFRS